MHVTKSKWIARYGLDAVELISNEAGKYKALVCGYSLKDDERVGGIYVVSVDPIAGSIAEEQFFALPAVLDARVLPDREHALVSCADGTVRCLNLKSHSDHEQWKYSVGGLATSVALSDNGHTAVVTDTKGGVCMLPVEDYTAGHGEPNRIGSHDAEVWCAALTDDGVVYSGGDDGYLRVHDARDDGISRAVRLHGGVGITSAVWRGENMLWTGGYDDYARVWDVRMLRANKAVHELELGGGVWRLKFHPGSESEGGNRVLAACMYAGVRILQADDSNVSIASAYEAHGSIAYGACWLPEHELALTCSFYDNALHLWETIPRAETEEQAKN